METRFCIEYVNPRHPLRDNGSINVRYDRVLTLKQAEHDLTLILSFGAKILSLYMGNVTDGKTGEWNPIPMIVDKDDWFTTDWLKSIKDKIPSKRKLNEDGEVFYNKTIGLLKQYASDNEVRKQSAMSCINWLKSAIKHEKIAKYKIGDRVRFFSHAPIFTISDIDEANERYISQSGDRISFYEELILVKSSINKDDIKCGDYLTTEDGTVIKVHDVDENECVHHFYYANEMTEDGGNISNNFMHYCAILSDCRRATQEEIDFLEKWVAHKKYVWVKNNVSPCDEEED